MKNLILGMLIVFMSLLQFSCDNGGDSFGSIQFYVEPEWTIVNGISAGDGDEEMNDGWSVQYDKFLICLSNVYVTKSTGGQSYEMDNSYVVDLKNAPAGGLVVAQFENVSTGDWDRVGYTMNHANSNSLKLGNISDDDFNEMVDNGLAVSTKMILTKSGGEVCPYLVGTANPADPNRPCTSVEQEILNWELPYAAKAEGCSTPSQVGLNVPNGGTTQVKLTIHADHHFFTALRHTDIQRLAQPLLDADLNLDGEVTLDELSQVPISVLDTTVYDLSTFPEQLNTLLDYVKWTTMTFPHYQGDGGCPERTPLQK